MIEVCLALMPYGTVCKPSLALGILKGSLRGSGISSRVFYPNISFADEIGPYASHVISMSEPSLLIGEWTFAAAAFPEFQPDPTAHLERLERAVLKDQEMQILLNGRDFSSYLLGLRDKATAFVDRTAEALLEHRPRIVGCSTSFQQTCASLALLRRLRELDPEVVTLLGGANCESVMGTTLRREFPWVDFVVSGEADTLFPDLCRLVLQHGREVPKGELPYGVFGEADAALDPSPTGAASAPRATLLRMDDSPIPDYDDFFDALRKTRMYPAVRPGLLAESSRGCWWGEKSHCTFCGLNGEGMAHREKSADRVAEELFYLSQRHDVRRFEFVDNILPMSYFKTTLPKLATREDLYAIFYQTKANLRREHLEKLAAAGVRNFLPGIESLNDQALDLIGKGSTALTNIQIMKWARELDMHVAWGLLYDIPGDSEEWYHEIADLIPWLAHLRPPHYTFRINYHRFSPYFMSAQDFGLDLTPVDSYAQIFPVTPAAMSGLAYHFQVNGDSAEKAVLRGELERPGVRRMQEEVVRWRRLYSNGNKEPALTMTVDGDRLTISDRRPCATQPSYVLDGMASQLYQLCESACSRQTVVKQLGKKLGREMTWDDVETTVDELKSGRLLVEIGGKMLGLAVNVSQPPLPAGEHPLGYVAWNELWRLPVP